MTEKREQTPQQSQCTCPRKLVDTGTLMPLVRVPNPKCPVHFPKETK